jgi:hypothetical protein
MSLCWILKVQYRTIKDRVLEVTQQAYVVEKIGAFFNR